MIITMQVIGTLFLGLCLIATSADDIGSNSEGKNKAAEHHTYKKETHFFVISSESQTFISEYNKISQNK